MTLDTALVYKNNPMKCVRTRNSDTPVYDSFFLKKY